MRRLYVLFGALTLSLVAAAPAAAGEVRTPVETGCATGFSVFAVDALQELGYQAPAVIDNSTNGGNGNGLVCGHPFPEAATKQLCPVDPCPVAILYLWSDDQNPAFGATR
jgi:hypothetical protein